MGVVAVWGRFACAQYTAVDLYRLDAPSGLKDPLPYCTANGQVVGIAFAPGSLVHAVLWNRDGSVADINPQGFAQSTALGIAGGDQFGQAVASAVAEGPASPAIWGGAAASAIVLQHSGFDDSSVAGAGGGQFVGDGAGPGTGEFRHALLWTGPQAAAIDLNPTRLAGFRNSSAYGAGGGQQVGSGGGPGTTINGYEHVHALLWTGSADSAVDLNPTNLPGVTDSTAGATNGRQQLGNALDHAMLWSGSADSAIDLNPPGFAGSIGLALNGAQQVGWGTPLGADGHGHALLWSGTAASAVDLHLLLPQSFETSIAYSIDDAGDVFGTAFSSSDFQYHAIEWLPHAVTPGDANLDGSVNFTDLLALAQHYGQSGGWVSGDFNDDGDVNFSDLLTLAQNYGQSTADAVASVPEPALFAFPLIAAGFLRRRR